MIRGRTWMDDYPERHISHSNEGEILLDRSMRGFLDDLTGETAEELDVLKKRYQILLYSSIAGFALVGVLAAFHFKSMKDKGQI